jgi:UDP-N-acetylmuramoyl-tripeptide--D-alanyl-D-alanine ligase
MENIFLYQLVDAVKGEFLLGDPHSSVTAVSIDTRTLHKDDYYFAIKGKSFDGHDFLKNAIDKHAKGIVISIKEANLGKPFPYMPAIVSVKDTTLALGDFARYYRKKFTLPVVGITGSNGKTTTKEMLATILQQLGPILKNQGNFNNTIGLPMTIFNMNSEHAFAVLEMGTSSF